MFYVSTVAGTQVPFDPALTPISTAAQAVAAASEVSALFATADSSVAGEWSAVSQLAASSEEISTVSSVASDDAAVFEGEVSAMRRDPAGSIDAAGLSRAGAISNYRFQERVHSQQIDTHKASVVESIVRGQIVDSDAPGLARRVTPVRRSGYQQQQAPAQRKPALVASDIMSAPVFVLAETKLASEAELAFKQRKFRHIPIVSAQGKLVGIVSDRNFFGLDAQMRGASKLRDIMSTNILTARPQAAIREIAEVMIEHHVGCLPIVDQAGSLAGILTRSDILRAVVNHAPIELWT